MKKSIFILVLFVFIGIIVNAQNLLKNAEFNVRMRKDNTLLINNKPIFPLLLWQYPQTTEFMKAIKAAGFNCFITFPKLAILQQAENNNMKVICHVDQLLYSATKTKDKKTWEKHVRNELKEVCKSPAILAYFLVDEPL
ncbi:MAG: hypothetical protein WCS73_10950, partial [Lentisphaeria bacterium]